MLNIIYYNELKKLLYTHHFVFWRYIKHKLG